MIGKTISHYRVTAKLGAGGMGEVYLAHDERLERDVALKVLPAHTLADEAARKRFRKETMALSKLNHPNIATIYDFDTQDGVDFLVMEYVEGTTLSEKLSTGPLSEEEATKLGRQVADALEEAHEHGVIHRDLKPGNVMVTPKGQAKVLDFGLAKLVRPVSETALTESLTETPAAAGTLPYMAPEQLQGQEADARTDIYALGAVLYQMATGRRPFPEAQAPQLIAAIMKEPPQPPRGLNSQVSAGLESIILKALEKDPEQRYQSSRELMADLERLGGPEPLLAARRRRATRRQLLATAAVAVVALLAVPLGLNLGGLRDRLLGTAAPARIESIAVLPLANLSGDPEQDYFAAGMHDALITDLAKLGGFKRVIARSSVMRYQETDKPLPQIARELGVDAVITGSVLREGDRVRITAQLINATTEEHLWAERYERELRDVLSLQNEIVVASAREIELRLTPEEEARLASARTVNPEAYEAYLKGRVHLHKFAPEQLETAMQYFQLALEKDPNYVLAYTGIASVWGYRGHLSPVPPREAFPKIKAAALKAFELDNTIGQVHNVLAGVSFYWDRDWSAAEREYQRAIELNPNYPAAHVFYWHFLNWQRRPEEARAHIERALELDPFQSFFQNAYGVHLLFARRYDEAIVQVRKVLRTDPNFQMAQHLLWLLFQQKGMYEEELAEKKQFSALLGDRELVEAIERGYGQGGYAGAMRLAAETLAARSKRTYVKPTQVAHRYAYAGEKDRALEWLEKGYQERDTHLIFLNLMPDWDSLRSDPRFQDPLRRMNFPE